jgi:hypothetical protein
MINFLNTRSLAGALLGGSFFNLLTTPDHIDCVIIRKDRYDELIRIELKAIRIRKKRKHK